MNRTTQRLLERLTTPPWSVPVAVTPHKCPVCNGRGTVSAGFYQPEEQGRYTLSSLAPETCKSCKGKGVIWT